MDHDDIIERAAESIMQRVNDTWPRTLHKDMLVDEISKAIKEATQKSDWSNWPPAVMTRLWYEEGSPGAVASGGIYDLITTSHDNARKKLGRHLKNE